MDYYQSKPEDVRAFRFMQWHSYVQEAEALHAAGINAYPVPAGYEHGHRLNYEKDGSCGDVLDSAPAYLMVGIDGKWVRVDIGWWVVIDSDGKVKAFSDKEFKERYRKPVTVEKSDDDYDRLLDL
ncbi:hypothetical protein SEA_YAKULT_65 [Gordonia phage Yakult]|nr:hypothetical protein SEA_YAKULT_65 [Gordonia phage Yakult]